MKIATPPKKSILGLEKDITHRGTSQEGIQVGLEAFIVCLQNPAGKALSSLFFLSEHPQHPLFSLHGIKNVLENPATSMEGKPEPSHLPQPPLPAWREIKYSQLMAFHINRRSCPPHRFAQCTDPSVGSQGSCGRSPGFPEERWTPRS